MNRVTNLERQERVESLLWPQQPDFGPTHIKRLSQLRAGKRYLLHQRSGEEAPDQVTEFEVARLPLSIYDRFLYVKKSSEGEDGPTWSANLLSQVGLVPHETFSHTDHGSVAILKVLYDVDSSPYKFEYRWDRLAWVEDPTLLKG